MAFAGPASLCEVQRVRRASYARSTSALPSVEPPSRTIVSTPGRPLRQQAVERGAQEARLVERRRDHAEGGQVRAPCGRGRVGGGEREVHHVLGVARARRPWWRQRRDRARGQRVRHDDRTAAPRGGRDRRAQRSSRRPPRPRTLRAERRRRGAGPSGPRQGGPARNGCARPSGPTSRPLPRYSAASGWRRHARAPATARPATGARHGRGRRRDGRRGAHPGGHARRRDTAVRPAPRPPPLPSSPRRRAAARPSCARPPRLRPQRVEPRRQPRQRRVPRVARDHALTPRRRHAGGGGGIGSSAITASASARPVAPTARCVAGSTSMPSAAIGEATTGTPAESASTTLNFVPDPETSG